MREIHLVTFLCITLLVFSCKKEKGPVTPPPNYTSYLENKTNQKVTVDIYYSATGQGYDSFIKQVTVEASSKIKIPGANMIDGTTYIYDWYSADYKLTNWMPRYPVLNVDAGGSPYPGTTFHYNGNHTGITTIHSNPSDERLVCLNGNGRETVWQAVDAYDKNGVSVWDTLAAARKDHKLVISFNGALIDSNLEMIHPGEGPLKKTKFVLLPPMYNTSFWLETTDGTKPRIIMGNNFNDELHKLAPLSTKATDTLFYCLYYSPNTAPLSPYVGPFYKMARIATRY